MNAIYCSVVALLFFASYAHSARHSRARGTVGETALALIEGALLLCGTLLMLMSDIR